MSDPTWERFKERLKQYMTDPVLIEEEKRGWEILTKAVQDQRNKEKHERRI